MLPWAALLRSKNSAYRKYIKADTQGTTKNGDLPSIFKYYFRKGRRMNLWYNIEQIHTSNIQCIFKSMKPAINSSIYSAHRFKSNLGGERIEQVIISNRQGKSAIKVKWTEPIKNGLNYT